MLKDDTSNPLNTSLNIKANEINTTTRITENGTIETTGFLLAPENTSNRTWKEYIRFRATNSTITRYWYHCDLEPDDANDVVTTAFIVNAVILTIPFGLMPILNIDYWNYFFCQAQVCGSGGGINVNFQDCLNGDFIQSDDIIYNGALYGGLDIYMGSVHFIYWSVYSSIIGLILASLFFIFIPQDIKRFRIWWIRGRIVLAMVILSILLSLGGLLGLIRTTLPFALESTNYSCIGYESLTQNFVVWSVVMGVVLMISFAASL